MPEYGRVEDLPEFLEAYTNSQIALVNAGEDEAAKLRAQLAWSEKKSQLESQRVRNNDTVRAVDATKTRVKELYPNVPEHLYANLSDPAQIEATAKDFHDALVAAKTPATPPPSTATGQPPTGIGGDQRPTVDWVARLGELREKINDGKATRADVDEFQNIRINMQMVPGMQRAKEEARRNPVGSGA